MPGMPAHTSGVSYYSGRMEKPRCTLPEPACDVAIIGGGPVGLLLANLLGARGLRIVICEKRTEAPSHSQAIGITPPSLEILAPLGFDEEFVRQGVRVSDVFVHGESGHHGVCTVRD